MFKSRTLRRLEQMLDAAISGSFSESDYDESVLSRIEAKWKHFLSASVLSRENLEREKNNLKELVSDISHQTKTPMANICLYVDLLDERITDEENKKIINELKRQTDKLEFLIQSLTKMSRLENNIVEVKPKRQEIKFLLQDVLDDIRPKAAKKDISVICSRSGKILAYYDRKWTKEALENVVDNAVKYSKPNSRIVISVKEYEMYAAISVKDNGIGIKETDTSKIFSRFYRAEEVQQEDGIGIGLYLTREMKLPAASCGVSARDSLRSSLVCCAASCGELNPLFD